MWTIVRLHYCVLDCLVVSLHAGPKQWQLGDHWYFLSNNVSEYKDLKMDWFDARNLCRKHCMESVSIETDEENDMVIKLIESSQYIFIKMAVEPVAVGTI